MKKTLTTILILFFAVQAFPQKDTIRHSTFMGGEDYVYQVYDTIPVWIECQDTVTHYYVSEVFEPDSVQPNAKDTGISIFAIHGHTIHDTTGHWSNNTVYGIRGYQVRKNSPSFDHWSDEHDLYAYMGWRNHFSHVMFLDNNKKPLQYFVWSYK